MVKAWVLLLPQRAPPSQHSQMQTLEEWTGVRGEVGRRRRRMAVKRRQVRNDESVDASDEVAIVMRYDQCGGREEA